MLLILTRYPARRTTRSVLSQERRILGPLLFVLGPVPHKICGNLVEVVAGCLQLDGIHLSQNVHTLIILQGALPGRITSS